VQQKKKKKKKKKKILFKMTRLLRVSVPSSKADLVHNVLLKHPATYTVRRFEGIDGNELMTCKTEVKFMSSVLDALSAVGVGVGATKEHEHGGPRQYRNAMKLRRRRRAQKQQQQNMDQNVDDENENENGRIAYNVVDDDDLLTMTEHESEAARIQDGAELGADMSASALLKRGGGGYGHIDIMHLQSCIPPLRAYKAPRKGRAYRMSERMSIQEIYQSIDKEIHMTFDYLALCVIGALISAVGLIQNSSAVVVASMLVSPLMFPIMGMCFGTMIHDKSMIWVSFRNVMVGVFLMFLIGFLVGLVMAPFRDDITWPTDEMTSRGTWGSLVGGVAVAIPSGAGVAIAITGAISATLVGVAIAAALLPPIVNSAMNIAFGLVLVMSNDSTSVGDQVYAGNDLIDIGGYSFALYIINWVLIYVVGILFFKLKQIEPIKQFEIADDQDDFATADETSDGGGHVQHSRHRVAMDTDGASSSYHYGTTGGGDETIEIRHADDVDADDDDDDDDEENVSSDASSYHSEHLHLLRAHK
jgi:uncharacterized hydrophobic protein (TIGR00271 family)